MAGIHIHIKNKNVWWDVYQHRRNQISFTNGRRIAMVCRRDQPDTPRRAI